MMIACLTFVLAGIAMPDAAETMLRVLLLTLAVGFVVARAYAAMLPATTTQDVYSPFADHTAEPTPPATPRVIRQLTAELAAADDERSARRAPIPWSVRWTVIEEATRRLAERHGLTLDDARHHSTIRSLVSEPTWALLEPGHPAAGSGASPGAAGRPVPLSQLDLILDDLEKL